MIRLLLLLLLMPSLASATGVGRTGAIGEMGGPVVDSAPIFVDTFTETSDKLLSAHTSDSGHNWTVSTETPTVKGGDGYFYNIGSGVGRDFSEISDVGPDVKATIVVSGVTLGGAGPVVRTTGAGDGYSAELLSDGTLRVISNAIGGVYLGQVGTTKTVTDYDNSEKYTIELSALGTTISADVKDSTGVSVITPIEEINSVLSASGGVGTYVYTSSGEIHSLELEVLRDFTATGSELVANSTFSTTGDWDFNSDWSIADGKLKFADTASISSVASQTVSGITADDEFILTIVVSSNEGTQQNNLTIGSLTLSTVNLPAGTYTFSGVLVGTSVLSIRGRAGDAIELDSISIFKRE